MSKKLFQKGSSEAKKGADGGQERWQHTDTHHGAAQQAGAPHPEQGAGGRQFWKCNTDHLYDLVTESLSANVLIQVHTKNNFINQLRVERGDETMGTGLSELDREFALQASSNSGLHTGMGRRHG
uniref:Uncharacterized protein n=1 Tax=Oryza punctata TaxID=4537 RepID=A0A0E0KAM3_ORYPU